MSSSVWPEVGVNRSQAAAVWIPRDIKRMSGGW